jgi:ubiquinone/menaquinone biosynthesis C-methylase UbiE
MKPPLFSKNYWNDRARKFGHTGHSEPFYYCFDQEARLCAIEKIVQEIKIKKNAALDFGCGSGDFLKLLATQFDSVIGLDVSENVIGIAKQKNKFQNVQFITGTSEIDFDLKFDLILTVTVLQSFGHSELENTLSKFANLTYKGSKIIFMEFFPSADYLIKSGEDRPDSKHWEELLFQNNFKILMKKNFYNPIVKPVKSWRVYKYHPISLILKPFKKFNFAQVVLSALAKKFIHTHNDVLLEEESPLKIYVVERI